MRAVIRNLILFSSFFSPTVLCFGQEGYELRLEKPKKYDNRALGYEKTYTKKFTGSRKFVQNTITHYNYFYNATLKIDNVMKQAKTMHVDDFTKLLPFYNYSLTNTAASKAELDSVIYKATAGIVLHDLRNDWIDNMYLLIGRAYFLRNDLDSAALTFQFLNTAFAPREKDGYAKIIASNSSEGGNAFLVSTKENRNLPKKMFSEAPSRNEGLIWIIRTAIEQGKMAKASALLQSLRLDPQFPERLKPELAQMQAYYFYTNNIYDSAAFYLEQALPSAESTTETSRWQFLVAQLHEKAAHRNEAIDWYNKSIKTTLNPIQDIYARLNAIRLNKEGGDNYINENILALYKMARRDNYTTYRDIIYFTAGIMDKERNNHTGIIQSMQRSIRFNSANVSLRNQAWVELGNAWFNTGEFLLAKNAYDSINLDEPAIESADLILARKSALGTLAANVAVVKRQDSLQYLARLPENERDDILKKIAKASAKAQRGKYTGSAALNEESPADLFAGTGKGEWYFYNAGLRSKGRNEFNVKWGDRPDADNWRRMSAIDRNTQIQEVTASNEQVQDSTAEITYESLLAMVPLTDQQMQVSNDSIRNALYEIGFAYQDKLEDYAKAAEQYEALLARFPNTNNKENIYFNLYYCYWKLGLNDKAARFKTQLQQEFPGSNAAVKTVDPSQVKNSAANREKAATATYEKIYNKFIEGAFQEALDMKRSADSMYGQVYWTPQLLYIEAVYHIKQRDDANAIQQLNRITSSFTTSPLAPKAEHLKSVLARRKEIEDYLTKLEVTRNEDETATVDSSIFAKKTVLEEEIKTVQSAGINTSIQPGVKTDIAQKNILNKNTSLKAPVTPDSIIQKYKDVDAAKNVRVDSAQQLVKTQLPVKKDSISSNLPAIKPVALFSKNGYIYNPAQPHYVMLVLDKVDPVYISEARNAFIRYNREYYAGQPINAGSIQLNDTIRLLSFSGFADAASAIQYANGARAKAGTEIVPWLPAAKYSFLVISEANLPTLQEKRETAGYLEFWQEAVKIK